MGQCYNWSILKHQGEGDRIASIVVSYLPTRIVAARITTATGAYKDLGPVDTPGAVKEWLNFTQDAPLVGLRTYSDI